MASITGWFTSHGRHIPILDGESKTQALARFANANRKRRLDKEYYKQRAAGKDWKEANEAIRRKITGREKNVNEMKRDTDTFNTLVSKFENRGVSHEDAVVEAEISMGRNPYNERARSKTVKDAYNGKSYKMKNDSNRGNTVAERKILDAVQTSSSKYNLSNIKVVIDSRGGLNIRTKDNKDICTLRRDLFTDKMIDDLRASGLIKRASSTGVHKKPKNK